MLLTVPCWEANLSKGVRKAPPVKSLRNTKNDGTLSWILKNPEDDFKCLLTPTSSIVIPAQTTKPSPQIKWLWCGFFHGYNATAIAQSYNATTRGQPQGHCYQRMPTMLCRTPLQWWSHQDCLWWHENMTAYEQGRAQANSSYILHYLVPQNSPSLLLSPFALY